MRKPSNEDSDFARYYKNFPDYDLTTKQSRDYLSRIKEGDGEAFEIFVKYNMRLVMFRVLQYVKHDDPRAMDLVSEGTIGLYKAIEKFDLTLGFKFSTFAVWWINCKIRRALRGFQRERSTVIKNLSKQFETARTILRLATDGNPSDEAIANYLQWDNHTLRTFRKFNDDRTLIGYLKDQAPSHPAKGDPPDTEALHLDLSDKLGQALARLSPVEEDIVRRYYGLGCAKKTYEEIGNFYGMTKEWVRQRENKSLRKLYILIHEDKIPIEFFIKEGSSPDEKGPSSANEEDQD